ncbi:hypothetical protein Mal48_15380 [Thalassoglobus polymorphus]|uniref:Uncharacterized protein n=1 Tax=Thalassoglobus polymorphus TaxID=2527994 RepID=A0A517QKY1_9PLAN|nr:hypothetical protein Mal48_15380 [Thalassoglobus polymorphus]
MNPTSQATSSVQADGLPIKKIMRRRFSSPLRPQKEFQERISARPMHSSKRTQYLAQVDPVCSQLNEETYIKARKTPRKARRTNRLV